MEKSIYIIFSLMCVLLAYVIIGFEPVCLIILYLIYAESKNA